MTGTTSKINRNRNRFMMKFFVDKDNKNRDA